MADEKIPAEQWTAFFADFTRQNRGSHARIEVLNSEDVSRLVETENRPFEGLAADLKDGENAVWIMLAAGAGTHLNHSIPKVNTVWVRDPVGISGPAVEMIADDGSRTILELSRPETYALPAATG